MFLLALNRTILFAFQSFWRNIWLSLATVFIIFLAFVSVNFLLVINVISDSAVEVVKERIDVSVYFKSEVRESKIAEIKTRLESLPQVREITYRSAQENLEIFKQRHENNDKIQETLKELDANPMGGTLVIKAKTLTEYPEILKTLDDPAYADLIEERNFDDNRLVIDRINSIADNIKKVVLAVSLIFIIIAILIVFNTVRMAIFTHQNEIAVMKLVGAGNWFIRSPFIFESIFCGILGCVAAIIFLYPLLSVIQPYVANFFNGAEFDIVGYFNSNFLIIFGTELVAIMLINVFSSSIAIGKYLNV
jgi:cell division transport system permease protein